MSRPHPVDLHVGGRVRAIRKTIGLSLEALAADLGVAYQQLQKYETGANRISASMLYEIGRALKTPVERFYDGLPTPLETASAVTRAAQADMLLATTGGRDLAAAFLAMPRHLRAPLIALARGVGAEEPCAERSPL